ncbi:E3 ubiquitin-protein ligase UPL5-like [Silene latifolia]|uniref:E3 ubiquitin-protein ligase UPL5-like n=1 Tax=Silene latifolia TaxID=37657 RepID=UPI003D775878
MRIEIEIEDGDLMKEKEKAKDDTKLSKQSQNHTFHLSIPHSYPSATIIYLVATELDNLSLVSMSSASSEYGGRLDLQFFVRMISGGKTLVLQANMGDTVEHLQNKIQNITGIPATQQYLIYRGKQLESAWTMKECGVENDSSLQLVGRMRNTYNLTAWGLITDMVNAIPQVCRNDSPPIDCNIVKLTLDKFMAPAVDGTNSNNKSDYYKIFMDAYAPQALVMMYRSAEEKTRKCADECIRCIMSLGGNGRSESACCAMMLLEFCRLLKTSVPEDDVLFLDCVTALGKKLNKVNLAYRPFQNSEQITPFIAVQDVFPFLEYIGHRLQTKDGPCFQDVSRFSAFLKPILRVITSELDAAAASRKPLEKGKVCLLGNEINGVYCLFFDLLRWIGKCLRKMGEACLENKRKKEVIVHPTCWSQYLAILKELRSIAILYPGFEDRFWNMMRKNKVVVSTLVVLYATHVEDHAWLLKHKDILKFKSRRHLVMFMFPERANEGIHEMLIDRSQLLTESFEYIYNAQPSSLQDGLFIGFKNERATGPGVLREWFYLVFQALFDPRNALFVACPMDRRRVYPNPASKVHPVYIEYFRFAGRVIALALMHKIQIGYFIDRVFFLQLAGRSVSLEDIKDADPYLYNSCKQIMEMDPEFVDSDALCLTFVAETEELGSREVVELCSGGKDIVVNSKNRKEYVHLVVQQRFVTSIAEQVSSFAQGFTDILRNDNLAATFFESLKLKDIDWMLHGSGSEEISIEDWKEHTEYVGYKKSDIQIVWFWKVVEELNVEQKKTLLFFWTSIRYLPVEGFCGLASKLFIHKSLDPQDRLPSSHTCFYQLCIPRYPTKAIMETRIRVITQEHVGCSFGTR